MTWKDALLIAGGIAAVTVGSLASKLLLFWMGLPT